MYTYQYHYTHLSVCYCSKSQLGKITNYDDADHKMTINETEAPAITESSPPPQLPTLSKGHH
jgi:hypothetical protein